MEHGIKPALFAATNLKDAIAAATPGGIEAQEKQGQAAVVEASVLPREIRGTTSEELETIGFKFGAFVDELFQEVVFPPGWTKKATEHDMHSDILDELACKRASIFYKAAFYDRRADVEFFTRYDVRRIVDHENFKAPTRIVIHDAGEPFHVVGECASTDYPGEARLRGDAKRWLDEHLPAWRSVSAYWGDDTFLVPAEGGAQG